MSNDTTPTDTDRRIADLEREVAELRGYLNDLWMHSGIHRSILSILLEERAARQDTEPQEVTR